jgi:hypothetical protein
MMKVISVLHSVKVINVQICWKMLMKPEDLMARIHLMEVQIQFSKITQS